MYSIKTIIYRIFIEINGIPEQAPSFVGKVIRNSVLRGMYYLNITPWLKVFDVSKIHIVDGSNLGNLTSFVVKHKI